MTNSSDVEAQANQQLSALADGELDVADVKSVLEQWSTRPAARRAWHDYHLIGDVLRSEDLASATEGDADFLAAVRKRLAAEPTVLAPTVPEAVAAPSRQRPANTRRVASYAAIAAGFLVVVAGTLTITGLPFSSAPIPGESIAARSDAAAPSPGSTALASADLLSQVEPTVASGQLIRDARLDRYFSAHQQWSSNAVLGGHAAYVGLVRPTAPRVEAGSRMDHRVLIIRVLAGALAAAFALATAAAANAAEPTPAASRRAPAVSAVEARQWLQRIQQAPSRRNFQGTFVVTAGGALSSARMAHYQVGNSQYELIESLNGQARLVFRHDDLIQTNWPQHRVALIEQREKLGSFPALLEASDPRIVEFYELRILGEDRVAGRIADVLQVVPRDGLRFSKRLWVDRESGLLLREDVLSTAGQVLESSAFSDVAIDVRAQPETVLAGMKKLDGYRVVRPTLTTADLDAEGWIQRQMVPGFRRVSCIKRPLVGAGEVETQSMSLQVLQTIYTDGLTYVSLFIEPYDATRHTRPVLTSIGATHTLMVQQGDWWFTVVGDVPAAALQAFAKAVERKR